MSLDVLISCMNQKDSSLIKSTNIQSNVVIVNQCGNENFEEFNFFDKNGRQHRAKFISVNQVGLSKSRNKAIGNAESEFCLLCDDDEVLVDASREVILRSFKEHPDVDVIAFALDYKRKNYPDKIKKINKLGVLKINSPQIAFRRKSIVDHKIIFDELMGSGTGNGGGEENKFLVDCCRLNLNIIYLPIVIAKIKDSSLSQWNTNFDKQYFLNRGWSTRRILGLPLSLLYAVFFTLSKYGTYSSNTSFFDALKFQITGIFEKR